MEGEREISSVHQEGEVEFDLEFPSPITDDIRARGTFPRIKPRTERPDLEREVLHSLVSRLLNWADEYFQVSTGRETFENLATSCVQYTVYVEPWTALDSDLMDLEIRMIFWCTLLDDFIEQSPPTAATMIREQNDHFQRLWCEDESSFEPPQQVCDLFVPLCESLLHIRDRMRLFPAYAKGFPAFIYYRRRYNKAAELVCSLRNQDFLNVDMFKYWRSIVFYMDASAVTFAMLHDILPEKETMESPYMIRLFQVMHSYGFLANDILGIKRDIHTKEQNFIVFQLKRKMDQPDIQKELNHCVEQMCQKIKEDLVEYIDIRARLLNSYSSDAKLEKFLELLDSCVDGHFQLYLHSQRYLLNSKDSIILKRCTNK